MSSSIKLDVVSAEKMLLSREIKLASITGGQGEIGIHPGHSALLTFIKPGHIRVIMLDNSVELFYVSGGILEVQPMIITVLADVAERALDLDEEAAQKAREVAKKALSDKVSAIEYSAALAQLAEATAQLRVIDILKNKSRH